MSCKVTNVTVRLLQLLQNLSVLVWVKLSTPLSHTNRETWTLNTEMWAVKDFWRCNYRSHSIPGVPVRRAIVLFFVKIKCWLNVSHWAGSLGQLESQTGVTVGHWWALDLTELALTPPPPVTPTPVLHLSVCSKCGTLPPESCVFSLICSTGSFMGEFQLFQPRGCPVSTQHQALCTLKKKKKKILSCSNQAYPLCFNRISEQNMHSMKDCVWL